MTHPAPVILTVDGIGPGGPEGRASEMTRRVVSGITDTYPTATPVWIPWPASYGPVPKAGGRSWYDSSQDALHRILATADSYPGRPLILIGFSGGNLPVHWALERETMRNRTTAVGFIADPHRPHDRWHTTAMAQPHGYGVAGEIDAPPDMFTRCLYTTHPADPISNAARDSMLRSLADLTKHLGDPRQFSADLRHTLFAPSAARALQLWWLRDAAGGNPLWYLRTFGPRLDNARREALAYLQEGRHTTGYLEPWHGGHTLAYRAGQMLAHLHTQNVRLV